ncbi:hypothetical protein [Sphingobium yanoikuyae]|uniref:DUF1565 domain-containing protein n=1 Tax=Sphingobium yanoikuyae TaxID=13690 RepID=A0A9X7U6P2_SPHYA|nr:hypothetical protein [Sphingobium yanoikuyae]QNG44713.1 hypothetical protein H3V42_23145 [Sphingobium yanoikuyae]
MALPPTDISRKMRKLIKDELSAELTVPGSGVQVSADNVLDGETKVSMTAGERETIPQAEQAAALGSEQPNLFTEGELNFTVKTLITGNADTSAGSVDGLGCWVLTAAAGTQKSYTRRFPRGSLGDATIVSASVHILSVSPASAGTGKARWVLIQRTAALAEITRQEIQIADQGGLSEPARVQMAAVALDANCAYIDYYFDLSAIGADARTMRFRDMLFARGRNPYFRPPPLAVPKTVYIGPAGSDAAAGTRAAPLATLNAAADMLKGDGQIVILSGSYSWTSSAFRLEPTKVLGHIEIMGERGGSPTGYDVLPIIYCSAKLAGITKTPGYTKVYQVAVASPGAFANFNYAYQDGVADPRTAVTGDEALFPQLRGRSYWLAATCRLMRTTATTLAAACAEIDAAGGDDPRAFVDATTLYFSVAGGGDATGASIYYAAAAGMIAAGTKGASGRVSIADLDIRYGGLDLTPFRDARIERSRIIGAKTDVVSYFKLSYHDLEVSCGGALIALTGDGLNGHLGAQLAGGELLSHHNNDDGLSPHEGSVGNPCDSGLIAYNGGSAIAVAYGANCVVGGGALISYRNQRRADPNNGALRYKPGAFCVVGDPTEDGHGGDGGVSTNAIFNRCVSIEDYTSFYSDDATGDRAYGWAIGCQALRPSTMAYNLTKATGCAYTGTSAARHARTVVETPSPVV